MKLLELALKKLAATADRFPALIIVSLAFAAFTMEMIHGNSFGTISTLLAYGAGFSVCAYAWVIAAQVTAEHFSRPRWQGLLGQGAVLVIAAAFLSWLWRQGNVENAGFVLRLALVSALGYLLMIFAPVAASSAERLWSYARVIAGRILVAALYAGLTHIGIVLAAGAVVALFDIGIGMDEIFATSFFLLAGLFATWFVAAGVPARASDADGATLPKLMRVLVRYILLPLVAIYFVILYVYAGKILFLWSWPEDGVVWWILGYSFVGILASVVSYTGMGDDDVRRNKFFRAYFALELPLVAILMAAIIVRVQAYGFTPHRYLVIAGGVVIALISVISLWRRSLGFRLTPYIAAAALLVAAVGPLNAVGVSTRSQLARLDAVMQRYQLLVNGVAVVPDERKDIEGAEYRDLISMVSLIADMGGDEQLTRRFGAPANSYNKFDSGARIISKYFSSDEAGSEAWYGNPADHRRLTTLNERQLSPKGFAEYDVLVKQVFMHPNAQQAFALPGTGGAAVQLSKDRAAIEVSVDGKVIAAVSIVDWLEPYAAAGRSTRLTQDEASLTFTGGGYRFLLVLDFVEYSVTDGKTEIGSASFVLLAGNDAAAQ